jgi:hypothetical protein
VRHGGLVARCAAQDIGTGSRTVLDTAVRTVFPGVDITVEIGSGDGPHGPSSGGSRTTTSIAPAAINAARALRTQLMSRVGARAADGTGVRTASGIRAWPDVLTACEGEQATGERGRDRRGFLVPFLSIDHMRVGRGLSGAVQICEVEVDTLLGMTRVLRVWSGLAVGRIWAPRLARNQAQGAVIQGVGFALYEQRTHDPNTGEILTTNLGGLPHRRHRRHPRDRRAFPPRGLGPCARTWHRARRSGHDRGGGSRGERRAPRHRLAAHRAADPPGPRPGRTGPMSELTSESSAQTAFAMAAAAPGEFRAGGTDVSERRRSGRSPGPIVDLTGLPGLTQITPTPDGGVRIGALVTVEQIARELTRYPALAITAGALATPEIRAAATMGGILLQRSRCTYYRNPAFTCFKSGGTGCPARAGHSLHAVADDRGPCGVAAESGCLWRSGGGRCDRGGSTGPVRNAERSIRRQDPSTVELHSASRAAMRSL